MNSYRIDWKAILKRLIDGEMSQAEARSLFYATCPRCGKAFEKKQVNAVFCGAYCQREGTRSKSK